MHSLGDSFGFRRSNEHLFSGPESRFRVPSGAEWLQGDLVTIDPASAGGPEGSNYLKRAGANAPIVPGITGILVFYGRYVTPNNIDSHPIVNTRDLVNVPGGVLANIVTGGGIKVWVKNLDADTRPGRKAYDAETRIDLSGLAVGDMVGWDGTKYVKVTNVLYRVGTVTKLISDVGVEFTLHA